LSNIKQVLMKSLRLSIEITILNVALSLLVSKVYFDNLDQSQITELFGNLTLLGAMLLFLYGGAIDFSGTAKWAEAMKLLKLHGKDWEEGDSREAERKALGYIICGGILLLEISILAIRS